MTTAKGTIIDAMDNETGNLDKLWMESQGHTAEEIKKALAEQWPNHRYVGSQLTTLYFIEERRTNEKS